MEVVRVSTFYKRHLLFLEAVRIREAETSLVLS